MEKEKWLPLLKSQGMTCVVFVSGFSLAILTLRPPLILAAEGMLVAQFWPRSRITTFIRTYWRAYASGIIGAIGGAAVSSPAKRIAVMGWILLAASFATIWLHNRKIKKDILEK